MPFDASLLKDGVKTFSRRLSFYCFIDSFFFPTHQIMSKAFEVHMVHNVMYEAGSGPTSRSPQQLQERFYSYYKLRNKEYREHVTK